MTGETPLRNSFQQLEASETEANNPVQKAAVFGMLCNVEPSKLVAHIKALLHDSVPMDHVAVFVPNETSLWQVFAILDHNEMSPQIASPIDLATTPIANTTIALLRYITAEFTHPHTNDHLLFKLLHQHLFRLSPPEINHLLVELAERRYKANSISLRGLLNEKLNQPPKDLFAAKASKEVLTFAALLEGCFAANANAKPVALLQQIGGLLIDFIPLEIPAFYQYQTMALQLLLQASESIEPKEIPIDINDWISQVTYNKMVMEPCAKTTGGISLFVQQQPAAFNPMFLQVGTFANVADAGLYPYTQTILPPMPATPPAAAAPAEPVPAAITRDDLPGRMNNIIQQQNTWVKPGTEHYKPLVQPLEKATADKLVTKFVMSATALNNYLQCPLSFYYNNILCVPQAKSAAMAFGTAVHYTLQRLFEKMQAANGHFPSADTLVADFNSCMHQHRDRFAPADFESRLAYGKTVLCNYYNRYVHTWPKVVAVERNLRNIVVNNVPVKGKPDKLEFNGHVVTVIDYKTGSVEKALPALQPPSDQNEHGGNYWRQAVFYKLLVDNSTQNQWKVESAAFDFIEPDGEGIFRRYRRLITPADVTTVTHQLTETWNKIQAHDFYTGCGKTYCSWCKLAIDYSRGHMYL